MDRIFHQRFTIAAKSGITILTLLAFWFFLQRQAIVGLLLVILLVVMIERVVHTRYIFSHDSSGFDSGKEEKNVLIIDKGRFSHPLIIFFEDIKKVNMMSTAFHLSHYILIEYGDGKMASFQPEDEEAFLSELKKRSK